MAKVKAPLFSFSAAGKLADSIVYFGWKGIAAVRSYAIPANPDTDLQRKQRGYLRDVVNKLHAVMVQADNPFGPDDKAAYAAWASLSAKPLTWFNQLCQNWIKQNVGGGLGCVYTAGASVPDDEELAVTLTINEQDPEGPITEGFFWYGTSKALMIKSVEADIALGVATATLADLVNGKTYFWQFRPTLPVEYGVGDPISRPGAKSGIYSGIPAVQPAPPGP